MDADNDPSISPELPSVDISQADDVAMDDPAVENLAPADVDDAPADDAGDASTTDKPIGDVPELQKKLNLEPTRIVLAKVKGYRAWPAMVLAEDILPENIQKMKPKLVKLAKKASPVIAVPVRFFSDDTYIWIKSSDLKVLSKEEIDTFLEKRANAKKHDLLIDAYKLAQNPPDMFEFNMWGSAGQPDMPDDLEDLDDSESPKKKLKLSIKLKNPGKGSKKAKPKPKAAPKKEDDGGIVYYDDWELSDDEVLLEEYDSDWGIDEPDFNYEYGDYIFEDKSEQQEFVDSFPRAADLADTLAYYTDLLADIHNKVSPALLLGEISNEKQIVKELRELDKLVLLGEMPLIAFTKLLLFRVLVMTLHRPKETFEFAAIRNAITRTLNKLSLEPCVLTMEDLVVETQESTPVPEGKDGEEELDVDAVKVEDGVKVDGAIKVEDAVAS